MRWQERRERMRALLESERCIHPASVFDPLSARIAHSLGFEAGILAGSIASLAVLGAPDLILLTLSEFVDLAHRITRASDLPLIVDADHGYGNAMNAARTVEELETAGVAAIVIEDTDLPRTFGEKQPKLVSMDEGIGKIRSALAARRDPALVIAGRTNVALAGLEGAITRAKAYRNAGADAIFLVGVKTEAEMRALAKALPPPILLGRTPPELTDGALLAQLGVRVALQPHLTFSAAMGAVYRTLKELRDGTSPAAISGLPPDPLMAEITRAGDYKGAIERFLTAPKE